jgi:hypothetical protein
MWLSTFRNAAIVAVCGASTATAEWTQFQANAQHTGYANSWIDATALTPAWSFSAPPYSAGPGDRSVAIVGGDVYASMLEGYGPSGVYNVGRYNGTTGALRWSAVIQSSAHAGVSAPSVAGDRVYVHHWGHSGSSGSSFPDDYPALVGLNRDTGVQELWTTHSGQSSSGSRPTIEGDSVFAAGGYHGGLDAYELNGTHRWFHNVNQQYGWVPAADGDNVYVYMGEASASPGPGTGTLFVVDRATGARRATILHPRSEGTFHGELQSVVLGGRDDAFALTYNAHPAALDSRTLVSFDLLEEDVAWEVDGQFNGNPAVAGGKLVVPDGNLLRVLEQDSGATLWTWSASDRVFGNVVLTNRYAFVNAAGSVHAIDLASHTSVWSSDGVTGSIALEDGLLVISNPSGIYAYTAPVPEPSTWALCLIGFGCFAFSIWRQHW